MEWLEYYFASLVLFCLFWGIIYWLCKDSKYDEDRDR
jgi:hypothetical protein